MKSSKKQTAFNTHLSLALILFLIFAGLAVLCGTEKEMGTAVGFAVAALLPLFFFFISPLYFVFSEDEVRIVYCFGQRECIPWSGVRSVSLIGSWVGVGMPYYSLAYPTKEKRPFFVRGEIAKTGKTKRLIQKYYKRNVL